MRFVEIAHFRDQIKFNKMEKIESVGSGVSFFSSEIVVENCLDRHRIAQNDPGTATHGILRGFFALRALVIPFSE